ncbi:calcium-binding allergen Ole e 8-like [Coffea arabica]|uniref:Calcium-binding allergen Ole e 8-like n=1 Tax=Coffea arabica TaxID=13443 RepID=A0ABM4U3B5_COFAR
MNPESKATTMATTTTNNADSNSSKPSAYLQDADEVQKVFERFDANSDGKISSEELAGVMKALGSDTSPDEISRMMVEIDTDKDGFINLEEFTAFCSSNSLYGSADGGDGGVKELHDAFELYDQDHDGFISATELHLILTRLGERCSVQDCEKMIKSVDEDGDARVSFQEFKIMMTNSKKA